jgi:hypothetical protein
MSSGPRKTRRSPVSPLLVILPRRCSTDHLGSPTMPRNSQCLESNLPQRCCLPTFRQADRPSLRPALRHAVPSPILDGAYSTQHVCPPTWWVFFQSLFGLEELTILSVNIAHALLLDRAPHSTKPTRRAVHAAIALLTFTTVVFRSEVLLLLGPLVLQAMVQGYTSLINIITFGLVSGVLSLGDYYQPVHTPLDSKI